MFQLNVAALVATQFLEIPKFDLLNIQLQVQKAGECSAHHRTKDQFAGMF
jgi:hypothetical protein